MAQGSDTLAAQLSAAAYSTPSNPPWSGCHVIESGNARAIVAITESQQWIAIAGTDDPSDWLDNINTRQRFTPWGSVHAGFWSHLERIRDAIESELVRSLPVHITGHSLGGACATLIVPHLLDRGFRAQSLTTFGAPRCGDREFRQWINSVHIPIRRHVNNNDIVPRVPAAWRGFRHAGKLIYHSSKRTTHENPSQAFITADRIRGRVRATLDGLTDGLSDHAMWRYERCV